MHPETPDGSLVENASAKLNLFLHVTGKRADGYHLLQSLVAFTDAGDVLRAGNSETLELHVSGRFADRMPQPQRNSVWHAANLLRDFAGCESAARITLEKNLPVAAGIGGGSADAAAALRLLSRLWQLDLHPEERHALAVQLGADVPVCMESKPCYMEGIGELRTAIDALPACWLVLANPGVPLLTADVFKALKTSSSTPIALPVSFSSPEMLAGYLAATRNDLQATATKLLPVIEFARNPYFMIVVTYVFPPYFAQYIVGDPVQGQATVADATGWAGVIGALTAQPGCMLARMSGSGPTCFGLFTNEDAARAGARNIATAQPEWWVAPTRMKGTL